MSIDRFNGKYRFLSNFYVHSVEFEGNVYLTSEHAFQAAKSHDLADKAMIKGLPEARQAKAVGQRIKLRPDWSIVRIEVMKNVLRAKFKPNSELAILLMRTAPQHLIEGNYWHDNFWGNCTCNDCQTIPGENWLGLLLMAVRSELLTQRVAISQVLPL